MNKYFEDWCDLKDIYLYYFKYFLLKSLAKNYQGALAKYFLCYHELFLVAMTSEGILIDKSLLWEAIIK